MLVTTIVIRIRESFSKVHVKIKRYVNGNWGFPFIAGFIVLLFVAAVFLAARWASLADATAVGAYFALAAGVVLQLVDFGRLSRFTKMLLRKVRNRGKNQGVVLDGSS